MTIDDRLRIQIALENMDGASVDDLARKYEISDILVAKICEVGPPKSLQILDDDGVVVDEWRLTMDGKHYVQTIKGGESV